jgi:hypothetical protein
MFLPRSTRPGAAALAVALLFVLAGATARAAAQAPVPTDVPVLQDVEDAFGRIETRGTHATACTNGLIPKPLYRATFGNFLFGLRNHFQGIQRLPDPDYVVISGSNKGISDLFIVRVAAPPGSEPSSCNGAVIARIIVDDVMWHPGGLSMLGSILAVPVFGGTPRMAKVVFFDLSAPASPRRLPIEILRPGRKATATALTRLPSGHVLVAVLSAFDGLPRRIDFYRSRTADIAEGFEPEPVTWRTGDVRARPGQDPTFSHFQNINFINQADGRLYLLGSHNSTAPQTLLPGRDYLDLYEVVFPNATIDRGHPVLQPPTIVKVAKQKLQCTDGYCNLDTAAGLFVDPVTQSMSLYATPGWLDGDTIKMTVYPTRPGKPANAQ